MALWRKLWKCRSKKSLLQIGTSAAASHASSLLESQL
jgi:hypothetical protein